MQQQPGPRSVEETVGAGISELRAFRGLTQRQFAAKLTEAGMPVDASAVSRIEKGTRSIRLVEAMVIADVLNVKVDLLIQGIRTPEQELKDIRNYADLAMHRMEESFASFGNSLLEAKQLLEAHPELAETLVDGEVGRLVSPDQYLPWVLERIRLINVGEDDLVFAKTSQESDQLIEIATTWVSQHIRLEAEQDNHGEHSEEA